MLPLLCQFAEPALFNLVFEIPIRQNAGVVRLLGSSEGVCSIDDWSISSYVS